MKLKTIGRISLSAGALTLLSCNKDIGKPNVVLILADDMGYSDIGCFGSEINTPNIDKLGYNGLRMTNFYNTSRSCPSRASLLTGRYSHNAGIGFMTPDFGNDSYRGFLNKESLTIAEVLKLNGYSTYMSGKWHVGSNTAYWPNRRGFDEYYGFPKGGGVYFAPFRKGRKLIYNDTVLEPDSTFYSTDNFTNQAITFINNHTKNKKNPFFLYLPYIAPHFPLQAHKEDIEKYRGKYMEGFEKIRIERYNRLKELGIIDNTLKLSPPDSNVLNWDNLSNEEKIEYDLRMATYAGIIECLDRNIGRVINSLQENEIIDNTIIIFLSDNGGTHEWMGDDNSDSIEIGSRNSWTTYTRSWANVSNTPFRMYKHWVHEGGISTPLIVYYPKLLNKGINNTPAHIIDILPTLCELTGSKYPEEYQGFKTGGMDGISILDIWKNQVNKEFNRTLYWEHMGNEAVRIGKYKLVKKHENSYWELYDMSIDRSELNDISNTNIQLKDSLLKEYKEWAIKADIQVWDSIRKGIESPRFNPYSLKKINSEK